MYIWNIKSLSGHLAELWNIITLHIGIYIFSSTFNVQNFSNWRQLIRHKTLSKHRLLLIIIYLVCHNGRDTTTAWVNYRGYELPNPHCLPSCWKKPECREEIQGFRQSVDQSMIKEQVYSENQTCDLIDKRRMVWPLHYRNLNA